MSRRATEVPFDGNPLLLGVNDRVEVRDASGVWHETRALGSARYDHATAAGGQVRLTVPVIWPGGRNPVNWPAEDVRKKES